MWKLIWKITKLVIAAVIILGLFGGIYAWQFEILPGLIKEGIANAPPPVETVSAEKAKAERWKPFVRAIGTVKAASGVDVSPQAGGVVEAIHFKSGDQVKQGEKLVTLDSDTENADLRSLEATLRNAERDLDRKGGLAKKGIGSQSESDSARARRDETIAAIEKTRALISKKTVYAPFSGELGLKHVELGQYVTPGMALVWLQTLDPVHVDFTVPESELAKVERGQVVEASLAAYPGEIFKGTIETIDARMAADTRTLTVRAVLANPDRRLVPGMFANVAVVTGEPAEVVTVPETAITYSLYGDSVFVVVPVKTEAASSGAGTPPALEVERRFVGLGESREGRIAITSGLEPGEEVATAGQLKLNPGTRVTINNDVVLDTGGIRKAE
jgi:membrane fusion protein (multidrug efflux system)